MYILRCKHMCRNVCKSYMYSEFDEVSSILQRESCNFMGDSFMELTCSPVSQSILTGEVDFCLGGKQPRVHRVIRSRNRIARPYEMSLILK